MSTKTTSLDIQSLSQKLINPSTSFNEAKDILNTLYNHFDTLIPLSSYQNDIRYLAAVPTASGMALSLQHAAACFLDYQRTTLFLRGFVQAIKDKQQEYPNQPIHVFYAGCGPLAPFISLVAPLFSNKDIRFTVLEINTHSLAIAKKLLNVLALDDYVDTYYEADAVTFKIPKPEKFHILFSETLDALLYRESYVPILQNMQPQFSSGITVIPENVTIHLSLHTHDHQEVYQGIVMDTQQNITTITSNTTLPKTLPPHNITIEDSSLYKGMLLDTIVHIYNDYRLTRGISSLTIPYEMLFDSTSVFKTLQFTYQLSPQVELKCSFN